MFPTHPFSGVTVPVSGLLIVTRRLRDCVKSRNREGKGESQLKTGDELLVSARISPPANNNNFDEFDYARYLMRKGICGTGYVASGKWSILSSGGHPLYLS